LKKLPRRTIAISGGGLSTLTNTSTDRWRTVCTKPNNAADALPAVDALPALDMQAAALQAAAPQDIDAFQNPAAIGSAMPCSVLAVPARSAVAARNRRDRRGGV
jgi:hypothetical protein